MASGSTRGCRRKLHVRRFCSAGDVYDDSSCCSIVDVCVNQDLVRRVQTKETLHGSSILLRLHWGDELEDTDSEMSTMTVSQIINGKTSYVPKEYALALTGRIDALQEFVSQMYKLYNVKLLLVMFPSIELAFSHSDDSDASILTSDKHQLHRVVKDLFSKCSVSWKQTQLKLSVKKGIKVEVPKLARECVCFGEAHLQRQVPSQERKDTGTQTEENSNAYSPCMDLPAAPNESNDLEGVGQRFDNIERELAEQRKFMESHFKEQERQSYVIRTSLLHITNAVSQKLLNGKHGPQTEVLSSLRAYPDTMLPPADDPESEEHADDPAIREIVDFLGPEYVEKKMEVANNDDDMEEEEDKDRDKQQEQEDDDDDEGNIKDAEKEQKNDGGNDEHESSSDDEEEDSFSEEDSESSDEPTRGEGGQRKGPSIKEIDGDELRSLSPPRTGRKFNNHGSNKNFIRGSQQSGLQSMLSILIQEPADNMADYEDQMYGPEDTSQRKSYKTSEGHLGTLTRTKTHFCKQHGTFLTTEEKDLTLTKPDGSVETERCTSDHTREQEDYSYRGYYGYDRSRYEYWPPYSDLQSDDLNFDISRRSGGSNMPHKSAQLHLTKAQFADDDEHMMMLMQSVIGESPYADRLWRKVEEVYEKVSESSLPNVETALDTVICLDVSASMGTDGMKQAKDILHDFLNGIEDIAEEYELEENIALVTFGGGARVVHGLSNDYGTLKDALENVEMGGPSPLSEGLIAALACLKAGGNLSIGTSLKLPPRLIIVTDGLATGDLDPTAEDATITDSQEQFLLMEAFSQLRRRQSKDTVPDPVVIIPVGRSNMSFLLGLAKSCGGMLIEGGMVKKLSRHQRIQKLAGDTLDAIVNKNYDSAQFEIIGLGRLHLSVTSAALPSEVEDVKYVTKENISKVIRLYGSKYSFDNIHEDPSLPPLGTRVARGVDWVWGNQDTEGAGTIFNHGLNAKYLWVHWDNGHRNVYRYGINSCYDVMMVDDVPRDINDTKVIDIGMQVERGTHWHPSYRDQDGGAGKHGVVVRTQPEGRIMVRWQDGKMYEYRYGENNKYDVLVRDPLASLLETTARDSAHQPDPEPVEVVQDQETKTIPDPPMSPETCVWQRKDIARGWENYSEENTKKLETAYIKRPAGSCLVVKGEQRFPGTGKLEYPRCPYSWQESS